MPFCIGKNLNLDMARFREILLHEDRRVPEGGTGDPHSPLDCFLKALLALDDMHTDTAAARARLHDHRVADSGGDLFCLV
ncbi:MAG: hypothetical protein BWX50_01529 [Euryarchaeota archaeon ADurb.Bin009]|nr:MAG: hypothetical protein BWX50_01529 [Euryarchaeota archaeon ADurb.Bin009]